MENADPGTGGRIEKGPTPDGHAECHRSSLGFAPTFRSQPSATPADPGRTRARQVVPHGGWRLERAFRARPRHLPWRAGRHRGRERDGQEHAAAPPGRARPTDGGHAGVSRRGRVRQRRPGAGRLPQPRHRFRFSVPPLAARVRRAGERGDAVAHRGWHLRDRRRPRPRPADDARAGPTASTTARVQLSGRRAAARRPWRVP